jgi:hypothetical protein
LNNDEATALSHTQLTPHTARFPIISPLQLQAELQRQQHYFGHLNVRTQMAMQIAESQNQRIFQLERSAQQAAATTTTAAGNNNSTSSSNSRSFSTSNPVDVLHFVSSILITLPIFSTVKFQWRHFLTVEGRATVFNTTMMLGMIF